LLSAPSNPPEGKFAAGDISIRASRGHYHPRSTGGIELIGPHGIQKVGAEERNQRA